MLKFFNIKIKFLIFNLMILISKTIKIRCATTDGISTYLQQPKSRAENFKSTIEDFPYKGYSGLRVSKKSLRMVYHHDQTIAVVEIGGGRTLLNCELIEVFDENQADAALRNLTKSVNRPYKLDFKDMVELMALCDKLDIDSSKLSRLKQSTTPHKENVSTTTQNSIMSGIVPGTKWCGTGDIAETYFDLGSEKSIDVCCRRHDLCPVKVRARNTRYNLSNKSIYTKSHCVCDDAFLKCLHGTKRSVADFMGNIYFNILRIQCVNDTKTGKEFRDPTPY